MLQLVFAYGHLGCFLDKDIDGHKCRVGKQPGVHALVGFVADYLFFECFIVVVAVIAGSCDAEGFAGFVLERGRTHKFSDSDMHVQQKIHFRYFGNVALYEYGGFIGVDACGEVFGEYGLDVGVELFCVGVCGERVEVGHKEVAVVVVLQLDKFAECSVVVSQMEVSCRADAAENQFFLR